MTLKTVRGNGKEVIGNCRGVGVVYVLLWCNETIN
jgi:hypothetical protein